jgi:hypothetical protein
MGPLGNCIATGTRPGRRQRGRALKSWQLLRGAVRGGALQAVIPALAPRLNDLQDQQQRELVLGRLNRGLFRRLLILGRGNNGHHSALCGSKEVRKLSLHGCNVGGYLQLFLFL